MGGWMDGRTDARTHGWNETLFGLRFFPNPKPSCIHRVAMFRSPSCCASCETLFQTRFSQFMISMVSNDLHSSHWYPSRQSLTFYNHSLSFFQLVRISLLPVLLESFLSSPRSSLAVSLSFLASALAFGHLASFLQILRPSISLVRTLLVPPIISVRTLYQQVMPECVDCTSSHSVHSSVVVLGRGHTQLLTLKPFQTGIACMFLQPAPLFRMRCLCHSSGSPSSLREVPDVPPTETVDWRPEPSSSLSDLGCVCEPYSGRSVPFHPVVPMASLAGGIRCCEANDFAPSPHEHTTSGCSSSHPQCAYCFHPMWHFLNLCSRFLDHILQRVSISSKLSANPSSPSAVLRSAASLSLSPSSTCPPTVLSSNLLDKIITELILKTSSCAMEPPRKIRRGLM